MKCFAVLFMIFCVCSIGVYSQTSKALEQITKANNIWHESDIVLSSEMMSNKIEFFNKLTTSIHKKDSIQSMIFKVEYSYDKSFTSTLFDDAMESELGGLYEKKKVKTNYKAPTPIFYSVNPESESFSVKFGISKNGGVDQDYSFEFTATPAEIKSLGKMNLTKAKIVASFAVNTIGQTELVDSVQFIADKYRKATFSGKPKQILPTSKYSTITKLFSDYGEGITKDQFETSEQFLKRKQSSVSILDSLYSMRFEEPLLLQDLQYDADRQVMSFIIDKMESIKCEFPMDGDNARTMSKMGKVYGIAQCMINVENQLELISSVKVKLNGKEYTAIPNYLFIPHNVRSVVSIEKDPALVGNSSDTLMVISSLDGDNQKLNVYRINDGSLKTTFVKKKYDSWESIYLESGNVFVDFIDGEDIGKIKIIFTSLSSSSQILKQYPIDFGKRNFVLGGFGDKSRFLRVSYLNDYSMMCVSDLMYQKHHVFDVVNNTQLVYDDKSSTKPIIEGNLPPNFSITGLSCITTPDKGTIRINKRNSYNDLAYSLVRIVPTYGYLNLDENILLERSSKNILHNIETGLEKELQNLNFYMSKTNFFHIGQYVFISSSPYHYVYDSKADKMVGSIKIPENSGSFKFGFLHKGVVSGTFQIITFETLK